MPDGLNKVMLIGNLGRDPEMRYTQNGNAVTGFSLAVSRSWVKDGEDRQEQTDVPCPFCEAPVGVPCDAWQGTTYPHPPSHLWAHHSRIRASEAQGRLPLGQPATETADENYRATQTE